ncbi:MAG TPA: DUF2939 domain-containing protein [Pyrinomonadaceae bacterium]|nr:DUF2939 domain-containing protein [Pyrinomonadaceae bacterium]
MSAPIEKAAEPKRSRIVVNFDRAREVVAHAPSPKRGSRGAKILALIAIVFVFLIAGLVAGGYFWWQSYKTRPAYSLALLVDAVQRNDMAAFDEFVDTDSVVDNFVPQVTEKAIARYSSALTAALNKQVQSLVPKLLPAVKQKVRDEITREIKELAARAESRPVFLVALAMPYVLDIKEENDTAKVAVNLKDRSVELNMQRNGERWKITGIKDETLATRIVDNIAKDLPAIGSQLEKEVRKQLKKTLPGGLPKIPLLTDPEK